MVNQETLLEWGKSLLRAIWFAVLGVIVAFLYSLSTDDSITTATWTVADFEVPIGLAIITVAGFAAKAVDRLIHVSEVNSKGIALPFLQR